MSLQESSLHQDLYTTVEETDIRSIDTFGDARMFVKDETTQPVGSFKIRGALYKALSVQQESPELLENGLVTASSGNHAQGVALAAAHLGVGAHIYLPDTTAETKLNAITQLGATTHLVDGAVDSALLAAQEAALVTGGLFIHPFDDQAVIDGQATIGNEIAADEQAFDNVFVPVGGGGLLAGVAQALSAQAPGTNVHGVQLEGCDAFTQSVEAGRVVELKQVNDLADGTAVKRAGVLTLEQVLSAPSFESMIRVTNRELGCALVELELLTGICAETAAGLAFAGMRKHLAQKANRHGNHLALVTGRHRDDERFKRLVAA